ncbi:MAG: ribosome small subunit-dependent GTPase A [Bacteroidales bacterium]|nr:ribosome small subunit-dependent GTPase A [Bacteroidales bacterium]
MSRLYTGKVFRSTGSWYVVVSDDGSLVLCKLKGRFKIEGIRNTNPIAVGDVVDFEMLPDGETGLIKNIHNRNNHLIRRATKLSKATHIIAANVDQMVLIASLEKPRTSTGFIDRLLVTAEAYHIPSIIVFNKYDLYDADHKEILDFYSKSYTQAGYHVLFTSAKENINLEQFRSVLKGRTSLLSGHSGVGKSALINVLDGSLDLKEGNISDYHHKGTHTTTFAEMFPLSFGGFVIDTPGIKEFGLVAFEKTELGQRFPEMREYMDQCRFNNCLHVSEPGCAVRKAVEESVIPEFRYVNYLNMLSEIED